MTVESQILSVLKDVEAFAQLNIENWLKSFHSTRIMVLPNAAYAPTSVTECETILEPYLNKLREQGFNRSSLDDFCVKLLTDTTAMASTVWTRFCDDAPIERVGATYLFLKVDDCWKITMVTAHSPDVMPVKA